MTTALDETHRPELRSWVESANALATDAAGNFYVSDIEPRQVDRFDSSGKLVRSFGGSRGRSRLA